MSWYKNSINSENRNSRTLSLSEKTYPKLLKYSVAKMKLFQETNRSFAVLGIATNQNKFNKKTFMTAMVYLTSNTINCVNIFSGVENFTEYAESILFTSVTMSFFMIFIIMIFQWEHISSLIDMFEEFVEKRK